MVFSGAIEGHSTKEDRLLLKYLSLWLWKIESLHLVDSGFTRCARLNDMGRANVERGRNIESGILWWVSGLIFILFCGGNGRIDAFINHVFQDDGLNVIG